MDTNTKWFRWSNIVAASIIAMGLIAAALIISHPPTAAGESIRPATLTTSAKTTPPITQESAAAQFRQQVLAAPALHAYSYERTTYTLQDVQVTSVIYDAKTDAFTLLYDYVWQPALPPSSGITSGATTLNNDGYGHYTSPMIMNSAYGGNGQYVYVTIK